MLTNETIQILAKRDAVGILSIYKTIYKLEGEVEEIKHSKDEPQNKTRRIKQILIDMKELEDSAEEELEELRQYREIYRKYNTLFT